jgi:hypothetical protein
MITMRFDHTEEAFSSVLHMDKGQPYSVAINLVFISLSQQIPHALREFLDLEAGVDNDNDNVGGGIGGQHIQSVNYSSNCFPWH